MRKRGKGRRAARLSPFLNSVPAFLCEGGTEVKGRKDKDDERLRADKETDTHRDKRQTKQTHTHDHIPRCLSMRQKRESNPCTAVSSTPSSICDGVAAARSEVLRVCPERREYLISQSCGMKKS